MHSSITLTRPVMQRQTLSQIQQILRKFERAKILTHLILLGGAYLWVYPFLWAIGTSLKNIHEFASSGLSILPQQPQWSNYISTWNDAAFGEYFLNTIISTVCTVLLVVLFTTTAGYVIARVAFVGKKIIICLILLTLFLPHGYSIVPIFDIVQHLGLLNTLWSVILVQVASGMVFHTLLFAGHFTYFRSMGSPQISLS